MLRLQLISGLNVVGGSPAIQGTFANKKVGALIAYLCLEPTGTVDREKLIGLLWSESPNEQARSAQRQCIRRLRIFLSAAETDSIQVSRAEVKLATGLVATDYAEINAEISAGRVHTMLLDVEHISEKLLAGYEHLDQAFSTWLYVKRENWLNQLVGSLENILRSSADPETQQRAAQALVKIDATHEESQRFLMRHYARCGNTARAMDIYHQLWKVLEEDYDIEPDPQTQELVIAIKQGQLAEAAGPDNSSALEDKITSVPNLFKIPQIAVLPFQCGGPWTGEEYFVEGFRRELAASLCRFRDWTVLEIDHNNASLEERSSNSGTETSLYILDGIYYQVGDVVHQTIMLKNALSKALIWSERIELTIQNWFNFRRQLLQRISAALNVYLSAERLNRSTGRMTVELDIYDQWLRGQALGFEWLPESDDRAAEIFRAIIDRDPNFAPAYSSLVQIENTRQLVNPGVYPSLKREESTLALAKKGVQLDPIDTKTQLALAWSYIMNRQYEQSETNFRLAYDLNPNDPWTVVSSAMGLAFCGNYGEALSRADQALDLDLNPSRSHWLYQANTRFLCGRIEESVTMGERAGSITHGAMAWQIASLSLSKQKESARALKHQFFDRAQVNWQGIGKPQAEDIGNWVLSVYPIKDGEARAHLRQGLEDAGVPTPRI